MAAQGLRERKKQATRRHISDVATGLFVLRGFENVTIAEVAEAAGVAKKTVFNYFPRKEDLFLDRHADRLRELEQAIRDRAPGESVVAAMRRYHHELLAGGHPLSGTIEGVAGFFQVLHSSPALVSRMHEQGREIEDVLADVLADEIGDEIGDNLHAKLVASLVATTVATIFNTAVQRMINGDDVDEVRRDQIHVIDKAFDLLENGIGDYGAIT